MALQTWFTKRVGTRHPIIQGAFHRFGDSRLAGPVSAAGGLGVITAHNFPTPDALRADLRRAREATGNPIGVNFTIAPGGTPAREGRPRDAQAYAPWLEATLDEGVEVVFTSAYDGSPVGRRAKEGNAVWIHKCATLKHAVSAARKGADAIVIVGIEGSGFKSPNQHTTLSNITILRRLVSTPVIAAGGIGDGRGLAAALTMGACGVYLGTAFMTTRECPIAEKWKRAIVEQDVTDPNYIRKLLHSGGKDRVLHSTAAGAIEEIRTVPDFVEALVRDAEQVLGEGLRATGR